MYSFFTNYIDFNRCRIQRLEEKKLEQKTNKFSYFNFCLPHSSENASKV